MDAIVWIQDLLHREFEMTDLVPLTSFLRMEIHRDRRMCRLHRSHQRYIETILHRHGMADSTPIATPVDPYVRQLKLPSEQQADSINRQQYRSAVGSLIYAMIGTQPDNAFTVSNVSQHNSNPGAPHWTAIEWIFRYLAGTRKLGLHYGRGRCGGYCDADWEGGENRRSIGRYVSIITERR